MTDPPPSVVREVEAFCERHGVDPRNPHPSGVANAVDGGTRDEIAAALDELASR